MGRSEISFAKSRQPIGMLRILQVLSILLIVRVTIAVLLNYGEYFPPNFQSEFLQGREQYFWGHYRWAFYTHIISGPLSLILGTILISEQFRLKYRNWHRFLGRVQCVCVLFVVAPSGLWMAFYVDTGVIAAIGFATLAILTGIFVAIGWKCAVQRRFLEHRRWMWRCFLLLCSAVVLRLIAGAATATHFESIWLNSVLAWASWLLPLMAFELSELKNWKRHAVVVAPADSSRFN